MPQAEEIIRDLLHPTLERRIAAIEDLRDNWHIDYRPYLWRAIELEKEKTVQRLLVDLAITKLEDKSLRKMIRFIENGQLLASGVTITLNAYPEFESQEVRDALIKAVQRESKNITTFIIKLLQHHNLSALSGSKLSFLLKELLSPNISDHLRFQFASAFLNRHNIRRLPLVYEFDSFIKDYKDDPVVRRAVLRFVIEEKTKIKKPINYLWQKFDYDKSAINKLSSIDAFVLDSLLYRDDELRKEAILVMSEFILNKVPDVYPTQREQLNEIWQMLITFNLERKFASLENYDEETLAEFFVGDLEPIYHLLRMSEIPVQTLLSFVSGYLPRSYLLTMIRDDPNADNRKLCYEGLKKPEFWIMDNGFLGPTLIWKRVFERIIIASQHEATTIVKKAAYELIEFLINLVMEMDLDNNQIIVEIIEKHGLLDKISSEQDIGIVSSVKLMLKLLLKQEEEISFTDRIHHEAAINITKKILYNLNNPKYFSIILNFLDVQWPNTRKRIVEEIDIFIHDYQDQAVIYSTEIMNILSKLEQDEDVIIRTTAKLILKKVSNFM